MSRLKICRQTTTKDAYFGKIYFDDAFVCYSMERVAVAIPEGVYAAVIDLSPHLKYKCPHLRVPTRDLAAGGDAGIRIHVANEPCQVDGCIACGLSIDGDAIDHSQSAFDKLMALLPPSLTVEVCRDESLTGA